LAVVALVLAAVYDAVRRDAPASLPTAATATRSTAGLPALSACDRHELALHVAFFGDLPAVMLANAGRRPCRVRDFSVALSVETASGKRIGGGPETVRFSGPVPVGRALRAPARALELASACANGRRPHTLFARAREASVLVRVSCGRRPRA
jgi:hypothetical protein